VSKKKNRELITTTVSMNQLGNKVAYARIKNGRYFIYMKDLETGKKKKVTTGGYRINNQEVDTYMPLLDWQDAQTLGAIVFRRGNLFLDTWNFETGEKRQKPLDRFRQIEAFSFNDNGRLAVISGDLDGQNDLYLISMRRNALRRITDDAYDDLDPVFIPGSAAIIFSSNRTNDSLRVQNVPINKVDDNFNLFIYDLDTTQNSFYRLTNTYSRDRRPIAKNNYFVYYLSDQKGITNLYRFNMLDTTFSQVTNFDMGIEDYDLHFDGDAMSFMMLDKGIHKVYYDDQINLDQDRFTTPTPRQKVKQAKFLFTRRSTPETGFELDLEEKDSTEVFNPMEPDEFTFEEDTVVNPIDNLPSGYIDTDNYVFSDEVKDDYEPDSFFQNYLALQRDNESSGPYRYFPRFSFGNITTSFANDPLRGFGFVLETEVVDMMENHRFTAGGFFVQDFSQSDLFGQYEFLPFWADFHFRVDRKVYKFETFDLEIAQKYTLAQVEAGMSVPVTHTFKAVIAPFYTRTSFLNLNTNAVLDVDPNQSNDQFIDYLGVRTALIYDNTVERGYNILQGSKGLIEYKRYQPVSSNGQYFNKLKLDLRHYQKVHREITLAGRFFYGKYWGANEPNFILGGVDNWLFNTTDTYGPEDPLFFSSTQPNTNILFIDFATNLRGYDYNEQFGNNAMVFNAEFRVPVFRYLIRRPISSNFLRNFQFVYFYDIGTAWSGAPPFTRENSFQEEEVEGSPFSARFRNFRNPWLQGYGAGVRMSFLGYYLKIDRARRIVDFERAGVKWHISIGVDF
jgi:hypothetical protein